MPLPRGLAGFKPALPACRWPESRAVPRSARAGLLAGLLASAFWQPVWAHHEVNPWPADLILPALTGPDLNGAAPRLSDFKGRVLIVSFWATWCEPCRAELPTIERLIEQRGADRVAALAVNYQEGLLTIRRYLQNLPLSLPVLVDASGALAKSWNVRVFPTTILIDREGRPRFRITGEFDWTSTQGQALIEALLEQSPGVGKSD